MGGGYRGGAPGGGEGGGEDPFVTLHALPPPKGADAKPWEPKLRTGHCPSPQLCWDHTLITRPRGPLKKWWEADSTGSGNWGLLLNQHLGGTLYPCHLASLRTTHLLEDSLPFICSPLPSG